MKLAEKVKQFLSAFANLQMFRHEPSIDRTEKEIFNAPVEPMKFNCSACGSEMIPVTAGEKRGAHYRHAKGKSCRPVRKKKEILSVAGN